MIVASIAYRLDHTRQNTWKIYLTHGTGLRRKPIGRVLHGQQGFWAETVCDVGLALTGPFPRLETAAKVVVQSSYETGTNLLSLNRPLMPLA